MAPPGLDPTGEYRLRQQSPFTERKMLNKVQNCNCSPYSYLRDGKGPVPESHLPPTLLARRVSDCRQLASRCEAADRISAMNGIEQTTAVWD
jgi:hypothetical protein